jgi:excisionase family DNA binding protein
VGQSSRAAGSQPAPEGDGSPTAAELWNRLPKHLQYLVSQEKPEVASRYYQTFKEDRAQLLQRLLDPEISLEEAARVLGVCPTTVRRYTNKGALRHHRTAGNQRRFRLSDVLAFLEKHGG